MHRLVSTAIAFAASAMFSVQAQGQAPAPALEGFTADPSIRVFGDTYYIYPTSDKPNWMTTDFSSGPRRTCARGRRSGWCWTSAAT